MANLSDDLKWLEEPNKVEFEHAGINCLILRDKYLWLGGYVGLKPIHPHNGKHFRDVKVESVHRGLNFSGRGDGQRRARAAQRRPRLLRNQPAHQLLEHLRQQVPVLRVQQVARRGRRVRDEP